MIDKITYLTGLWYSQRKSNLSSGTGTLLAEIKKKLVSFAIVVI